MSFSNDVREELLKKTTDSEDMAVSFLSAAMAFCGNIVFTGNNRVIFYFMTENAGVARKILSDFKTLFSQTLELYQKKNYNFTRKKIYILKYPSDKDAKDILKKLSILADENGVISIIETITPKLVDEDYKKKAYLRGAYLSSGSISNPEKFYHMEFVTSYLDYANSFSGILNEMGIKSSVLERNATYVIYVKESDSISDFLNYVGAHNNLFRFEDIRIKKQLRNDVNRIVNCEAANLEKTAKTFVRQKNAIEYIVEKKSINYLPEDLREAALLRVKYPSDSLKDLAQKMSTTISKSGINYRLKKIEKIADNLHGEDK